MHYSCSGGESVASERRLQKKWLVVRGEQDLQVEDSLASHQYIVRLVRCVISLAPEGRYRIAQGMSLGKSPLTRPSGHPLPIGEAREPEASGGQIKEPGRV